MKKLVILFICLLLCSCTGPVFKMVVIEDDEPQVSKLSLTFVGDALLHTPIIKDAYEDGRYNFAKMFEDIGSVLEGSDLAFYNQESIWVAFLWDTRDTLHITLHPSSEERC